MSRLTAAVIGCGDVSVVHTAAITKMDDVALVGFCDPDDLVVFISVGVFNVNAQNPEPPRKFADHDIGNKRDFRHYPPDLM